MPDEETKKVFLIRHAQSLQNVATAKFFINGDFQALGQLFALGYDAALSPAGTAQLEDAAKQLDAAGDKFAKDNGVQLVAHSPYQRAIMTAHALFPKWVGTEKMVEVPDMHERTIPEYFFPQLMEARIRSVRSWLEGRPETAIALVGHGQFFKFCVGSPGVQPNVSIREARYDRGKGFVGSSGFVFDGYNDPAERRREESPIADR